MKGGLTAISTYFKGDERRAAFTSSFILPPSSLLQLRDERERFEVGAAELEAFGEPDDALAARGGVERVARVVEAYLLGLAEEAVGAARHLLGDGLVPPAVLEEDRRGRAAADEVDGVVPRVVAEVRADVLLADARAQ